MNRRSKLILLVAVVTFLLSTVTTFAFMSQAKITVRVVDEAGKPVDGVNVGIGFGKGDAEGLTNLEGRFSGSANCNSHIGFNAVKSGYYMSIGTYDFDYGKKSFIRWEPWNPEVTIVLRKIENPVPMYARDTKESRLFIPVTGKDVGFDLIMYDWVKPYGHGKVADILCNLHVRRSAWNDFEYNCESACNNDPPREVIGIQN